MGYYVSTQVYRECVRESDPDDSWDQGDYGGGVSGVYWTKWEPDSSYLDYRPKEYLEKLPGYAVVVGYQTGSTFGSDFDATVVAVFDSKNEEKAYDLAAEIEKLYGPWEYLKEYQWNFEFDDEQYYAGTWLGYFERFESVGVYRVG